MIINGVKYSLKFLFILFNIGLLQAQQEVLQENDWYIEKVEISDEEVFPPDFNCSKLGRVYFENENFSTEDPCCETGCSSSIVYQGNNIFDLSGEISCLLDKGCTQDQWDFFTSHNGIYFDSATPTFYNPYPMRL